MGRSTFAYLMLVHMTSYPLLLTDHLSLFDRVTWRGRGNIYFTDVSMHDCLPIFDCYL